MAYVLFLVLSAIGHWFHEPWRDEWQAILIAQKSYSISELYWNARSEGHPILWFVLLYFGKFITHQFWISQVLHFILMSGAVFIILFRSSLYPIWRVCIPFGYFFLYEYNVIVRNYGLGIFLFFLAHDFYFRKKYWGMFLFITLSIFTNVYMTLVAAVWFGFIQLRLFSKHKVQTVISSILFAAMFFLNKILTVPIKHEFVFSNIDFSVVNWLDRMQGIALSYIVLPKLDFSFWHSNCIGVLECKIIATMILIVFLIYAILRRSLYGFYFLLAIAAILFFSMYRYSFYLRHIGHYYIVFISFLWMVSSDRPSKMISKPILAGYHILISCVLILQIYSAIFALVNDLRYPFSAGTLAAKYIANHHSKNALMLSHSDFLISPIAGYLQRDVFTMNSYTNVNYTHWFTDRGKNDTDSALYAEGKRRVDLDPILLVNHSLDTNQFKVKFLGYFGPAIVRDEEFWIYKLR